MEPITLCGVVVVAFGLWIEFEPAVKRLVNALSRIRLRSSARPLAHEYKSGWA